MKTQNADTAVDQPRAAAAQALDEYVLGTGRDELQRLGLQHRLWADAAHALFRRAQIGPGKRVLDIGCGPGYATLDLAELVAHTLTPADVAGSVVGVDESAVFIEHLTQQAAFRRLPHASGKVGDVQRLGALLPGQQSSYDAAYARWVLCFVPEPEAVVAGVAALLKPGGVFAVHDYFNYAAMTMAPRRRSHDRVVQATMESWRARGGDPDICARLPALMQAHGLELVHLDIHQRLARPGDSMFHWAFTWWHIYAPKLVSMGYLAQADCDELMSDLADLARSSTDFILPPPVTEILVRKRA